VATVEGSTHTIPQFRAMSLDELHDVRSEALGAKVKDLDVDTKQWLFAYVDAIFAAAEREVDDTHPGG
jgi:hypothetical protein